MPLDQLGLGNVTEVDITIPSGEEKKELAVNQENLTKGKALIDKAVVAHGGADNIAKVQSVSQKGTFVMVTPQGEFPLRKDYPLKEGYLLRVKYEQAQDNTYRTLPSLAGRAGVFQAFCRGREGGRYGDRDRLQPPGDREVI